MNVIFIILISFSKWDNRKEHCYYGNRADFCGFHPNPLGLEHVHDLASSRAFFARKFVDNGPIVGHTERWLNDPSRYDPIGTFVIRDSNNQCLSANNHNELESVPCYKQFNTLNSQHWDQQWVISHCYNRSNIIYDPELRCLLQHNQMASCAVINKKLGLCLDLKDGNGDMDQPLQLHECHMGKEQHFSFTNLEDLRLVDREDENRIRVEDEMQQKAMDRYHVTEPISCSLQPTLSLLQYLPALCVDLFTGNGSQKPTIWPCNTEKSQQLSFYIVD